MKLANKWDERKWQTRPTKWDKIYLYIDKIYIFFFASYANDYFPICYILYNNIL